MISAPAQQIKVGSLTAGTLKLSNITVGMEMVSAARCRAGGGRGFGGRLRVEPFTFDLASPDVRLTMDVDGIDAQGCWRCFPKRLKAMEPLWTVPLSYENGDVRFGEGHLGLKPGTTGGPVRNPGLLPSVAPLAVRMGLLNRIEGGQEALLVNELSIACIHRNAVLAGAQIRIMGCGRHPNKARSHSIQRQCSAEQFMNLGMKGTCSSISSKQGLCPGDNSSITHAMNAPGFCRFAALVVAAGCINVKAHIIVDVNVRSTRP